MEFYATLAGLSRFRALEVASNKERRKIMRLKPFLGSVKFLMLTSLLILGFSVCQANAQKFAIQAEDFAASQGESWKVLTPPATVMTNDTSDPRAPELLADDGTMIAEFTINEASGDFIGNADHSGVNDDWVKYVLNFPAAGDWYMWAKVIAPTIGDNSWHIGVDIPDANAVSADNDDINVWDFYEAAETPDDDIGTPLNTRLTTEWFWFRLSSRTGNPFPGIEVDQFGPNPTPLPLTAGEHTFHVVWREHSFGDILFFTMDASDDPNKDPSVVTAVELRDKLTTTWGQLKKGF